MEDCDGTDCDGMDSSTAAKADDGLMDDTAFAEAYGRLMRDGTAHGVSV